MELKPRSPIHSEIDIIQSIKNEFSKNQPNLGVGVDTSVTLIRSKSSVDDGCAIFLIDNKYILHLSPDEFPGVAAKDGAAAHEMKARLGEHGRLVLAPLAGGSLYGRSYIVNPVCIPLKISGLLGKFERRRVGRPLLEWLRNLAGLGTIASATFIDACKVRASHFYSFNGLSESLKTAIELSQCQLPNIGFKTVPMHGDLWLGNVMRQGDRLIVIDWGGSLVEGFAIFDLIRLAMSLDFSTRILRVELGIHAKTLGIDVKDTAVYLLAGLAYFASNLGEFPEYRFVGMAENCWLRLRNAVL